MKPIISFIAAASISIATLCNHNLSAQITLEHVYPDFYPDSSSYIEFLSVINLSSGTKYLIKYRRDNGNLKIIQLYNQDHSLFRSYDSTSTLLKTLVYEDPSLITDKLFDNDDDLEFLLINRAPDPGGGPLYIICGTDSLFIGNYSGYVIYDETTDSVYSIPGLPKIPAIYPKYHGIYNTSTGWKLIFSVTRFDGYGSSYVFDCLKSYDGVYVYSLPGTYPPQPYLVPEHKNGYEIANPFPNPTNKEITLPYQLPSHKTGQLIIYDMQGKEIKRFTITNAFKNIILNTSDMNKGMYIYKIICEGEVIGTKKFIVQ